MAKLIVKFGYMKPNRNNRSGFVEYIAKRDGVIKNIHSFGDKPATPKQKSLITNLLKKYPNMQSNELHKEYLNRKSIISASEFISHVEETMIEELSHVDEYVQYIAERPRVVKEGHHGLFSISDEPLVLEHVKGIVKDHPGNIWTAIISVKREDATRLGYDSLNLWKSLVRSKQNDVARYLKIDTNKFEWYGAFHDESHHPHIHLVMFAKDGKQGYLNQKSMDQIRSVFAREMFKDEHLHLYKKQTQYRDQLKFVSKELIQEHIDSLNQNIESEPKIDSLLLQLHDELKSVKGKQTYGYLPKTLKRLVDEIVDELSNTRHIQNLLDLWYEQRNEILSTYTNKQEQIRHLSDLEEFKSIKNTVIKLAKEIQITEQIPKTIIDAPTSLNVVQDEDQCDLTEIGAIVTPKTENTHEIKDNAIKATQFDIPDTSPKYDNSMMTSNSVRLLYQISNLFESSMIKRVHNYQVDHKLILKIRNQKIALGQHENDSHKN
ncbi:MobP3 family relaxase [Erysipelothrix anatis]|uniref:MobP3 family relaxase n=1 Tax=Erysipelothrix anatis TaxID=2683713 RepID=UPI0013599193|nr:MobP3 family relaxase [Erysipelothrix anatis]